MNDEVRNPNDERQADKSRMSPRPKRRPALSAVEWGSRLGHCCLSFAFPQSAPFSACSAVSALKRAAFYLSPAARRGEKQDGGRSNAERGTRNAEWTAKRHGLHSELGTAVARHGRDIEMFQLMPAVEPVAGISGWFQRRVRRERRGQPSIGERQTAYRSEGHPEDAEIEKGSVGSIGLTPRASRLLSKRVAGNACRRNSGTTSRWVTRRRGEGTVPCRPF